MAIALKTETVTKIHFEPIGSELLYKDFNKTIQCWTEDDDNCLVIKEAIRGPNLRYTDNVTEKVFIIRFYLSDGEGIVCQYDFVYPEDITKAFLSTCEKYEKGVLYFGHDVKRLIDFKNAICKGRCSKND